MNFSCPLGDTDFVCWQELLLIWLQGRKPRELHAELEFVFFSFPHFFFFLGKTKFLWVLEIRCLDWDLEIDLLKTEWFVVVVFMHKYQDGGAGINIAKW